MELKAYSISGMTCGGCVAKVKAVIFNFKGVKEAEVGLEYPQAKILFNDVPNLKELNDALKVEGNYRIAEIVRQPELTDSSKEAALVELATYKPLIMIVAFILGVSILVQFPFSNFDGMQLMRHFMGGFFIVFSFFKLLNLDGFVNSYSMYDIVAKKFSFWAYLYPFIELVLGVLFLINVAPVATNVVTIVVLSVSSIGVIQSVLNKQKIKCACLGDVFNLPMSTVTIVEDISMVLMATLALILI